MSVTIAQVGTAVSLGPGFNTLVATRGTVANGDMLIVTIFYSTGTTLTPPSGWTLIRTFTTTLTSAAGVYVHAVTNAGSEPTTYTWSFSASINANWLDLALARDSSAGTVICETSALGSTQFNTASGASPSVTTANANGAIHVMQVAEWSGGTPTVTIPTGTTLLANVFHNNSDVNAFVATKTYTTAGTIATGNSTWSVSMDEIDAIVSGYSVAPVTSSPIFQARMISQAVRRAAFF
jgi:hypothetical protein